VPLVLGLLAPIQYLAAGVGTLVFGAAPGLALWGLFGLGWAVLGYALWAAGRAVPGDPQLPARRGSGRAP
jgi:hypothetical protein